MSVVHQGGEMSDLATINRGALAEFKPQAVKVDQARADAIIEFAARERAAKRGRPWEARKCFRPETFR